MESIKYTSFIAAGLLLLAIADLPYGYYIFLRIAICGLSIFNLQFYYGNKQEGIAIVFGIIAVIFNPFIKVWFEKEIWCLIDVIAAIIFIAAYFLSKKRPTKES